ncbi:hypothetical protein PV390_35220 [Streptomyces sp. ME02-6991-2A]|uniref:hypothetical protein n=1 Tax=Streptomyces TaxID=1883 RepID=UPI0029ABCE7E|nr:hypothetical protein [Streptomyces sp. ME02-6991-2A]MDX3379646.1 hypothetical protein [Streptomyces sp. ME02-6991-2A]
MGDVLLVLSIPVLVLASGVYAVCACWWRRRHPAPPSPYTRHAARLAEQAMLVRAEEIVDDAYTALGPLYAPPAAPAPAAAPPAALSPRPDGSTPDRAPSPPAPARKP